MSFDSLPFAMFLAATLLFWRFVPRPSLVLIAASVAFYYFAGARDMAIVSTIVVANYFLSFAISRWRYSLYAAVLVNIGCLVLFKYRYLLFGGVEDADFFTSSIIIPLGISFYTFQVTAYQIDLYRGHCAHQTNFLKFALFVVFFPQLIAGPIVRSHQFMPQIERLFEGSRVRFSAPSLGLGLICLGIFKKVFIADSLAPHVDDIFAVGPADMFTAWVGAWLFTFQIYFDFSGYSDMAVGMARLFGIRLPVNFRQPYLSRSPREFWQRWHITLSSWIRDYLYIPLGGSRDGGRFRQMAVMVFVMGLAGLWHGANWTFAIWGVAWALVIIVWRVCDPILSRHPLAGWFYTFFAAVFLWVIFRSPNIAFAADYLITMLGAPGAGTASIPDAGLERLLISVGCLALLILHRLERQLFHHRIARALVRTSGPVTWGVLVGLSLWLLVMPKVNVNPFIYFRF